MASIIRIMNLCNIQLSNEDKENVMSAEKIPISDRYTLSIPEAAEYFGIGRHKLTQIINENPNSDFVIEVGSHRRIKRVKFEKFIDEASCV